MQTLTKKPKQLSATLALAVLAIGALVAVALIAGGSPAQATTTGTPSPDGNQSGAGQRPLATTLPCPGGADSKYATPAEVSSPGHYAIFDVYWDDDDKNLVTNPCPPEVEVEAHEVLNQRGQPTGEYTYSYTRVASDIQIDSTVIQVPGAGVEVRAGNQDDYQKWPFLYPDGTSNDPGEPIVSKVWVPPACPHDPSVGLDPGVLCIGFSAESLVSTDWDDLDFEFESIREPGLDPDDRGRVLVFYPSDEVPAGEQQIIWDTHDPDENEIEVEAGDDRHQPWLFTKPGRYVLAVHVKGHPDVVNTSIEYIQHEKLPTVTSLVRNYTFHVGALADLSVGVTATPTSPVPNEDDADPYTDDQVTITVTASNAGPDKGENTHVDVTLPDGLEYSEHTTATTDTIECPDPDGGTPTQVTYCPGTGVWAVGDLEKDGSATLTITATANVGTRGHQQDITAHIYATEHIGSSDLVELDPDLTNNTDQATVTPLAIDNDAPHVESWRKVDEHATSGTNVGGPIWFLDPDNVADLVYTLIDNETELASPHFTFTVVELPERFPERYRSRERGVQIQLTEAADLLGTEWHDLTLKVSDGIDSYGNPDSSPDTVTSVAIEIVPDPWEDGTLTVTPDTAHIVGNASVTYTAVLDNIPTDHGTIEYQWETRRRPFNSPNFGNWHLHSGHTSDTLELQSSDDTRMLQVRVNAKVNDEYGTERTYGPVESENTWE